jgi:hypothetical protein
MMGFNRMNAVENEPRGKDAPKSWLDEAPTGGLTYRQMNELYREGTSVKGMEDGVEVTVYKAGDLFVETTEPTEADLRHLEVLERLQHDLFERLDGIVAKLDAGARLEDI